MIELSTEMALVAEVDRGKRESDRKCVTHASSQSFDRCEAYSKLTVPFQIVGARASGTFLGSVPDPCLHSINSVAFSLRVLFLFDAIW